MSPATLSLVAATVNPTVALGGLNIIPGASTLVATGVDPVVIQASLNITPPLRAEVVVATCHTIRGCDRCRHRAMHG
jgi:hypothetical protein